MYCSELRGLRIYGAHWLGKQHARMHCIQLYLIYLNNLPQTFPPLSPNTQRSQLLLNTILIEEPLFLP